MVKLFWVAIGVLCLVFLMGEAAGRYYGLHSAPLYVASKEYEYIHAPNQKRTIYGNSFQTNEFSMRSRTFSRADTITVLMIGDSVINGGNLTDQDSLASTILEKALSTYFKLNIRVLNISSTTWGPDNGAAYVAKHGLFNADLICLVVSSHDAYDNMTHVPIVGISPDHPSKQNLLAWTSMLRKGLHQITSRLQPEEDPIVFKPTPPIEAESFNTGFAYFSNLRDHSSLPLLVYLHSTQMEIAEGKLMYQGQQIVKFCERNHIPLIMELEKGITEGYYRDYIHFNQRGQKFLADCLYPVFRDKIADRLQSPTVSVAAHH
jgi:lysophospholipase L1-like esterase